MPQSRQLAAIMFTDIVGYTALMGQDEGKAHKVLEQNRLLQKPIIEEFNGRWIKELGDGVMASFNTVSDGVNAAIKIQEACNAANDFQLRIGIHQGEVIFEDDDVFGDAVNLAARIQAAASPGCIFISETVHHNVSNKSGIETRFVKAEILKNVSQPVRMYQVLFTGSPHAPRSNQKRNRNILMASLVLIMAFAAWFMFPKDQDSSEVPVMDLSIAVLPFANMSNDPDQEFISDGLSDEIRTRLSSISKLSVTGRTSCYAYKGISADIREMGDKLGVSYVLDGSVRSIGNELRIILSLNNTADGSIIFSEPFKGTLDNIFELQDKISLAILQAINIKLLGEEKDAVLKRYTNNVEAYQAYMKGLQYYNMYSPEAFDTAITFFKEAIAIDSNYAIAYAGLSYCYLTQGYFGYEPAEERIPWGMDAAQKSYQLDNEIAESHLAIGRIKLHYELKIAEAQSSFQKSLAINPNSAECHVQLAMCAAFLGQTMKAQEHLIKADSLDPISMMNLWFIGAIYTGIGMPETSLTYGKKLMDLDSSSSGGHWLTGVSLTQLKRYDEAIYEHELAISLNPDIGGYADLGVAYGLKGEKQKALEVIELMKELGHAGTIGNTNIGLVYAAIGAADEAFSYFEKAIENKEGLVLWLKMNLKNTPLVNDPRAFQLYERLGLPYTKK